MEERLIELYCTICQCNDSRFIEGKQRLSNNNCPQFTAVHNAEDHLQLYQKPSFDVFPALPSYEVFCRRLNRLTPAFQALAEIWVEEAAEKSGDTHRYAVDSCPVMVARPS